MNSQKLKLVRRQRRRYHVRRRITGTPERPRLSVFRSSKHIYAQLIDDLSGETIAAATSVAKSGGYGGNIAAAKTVGQKLAEAAKAKGITAAAFDRGSYKFHGRVQALAVAATQAGLVCCDPKNIKQPAPPGEKPEAKKGEGKPKGEKPKGEKPKAEGKPAGEAKPKGEAPAKGEGKPKGEAPPKGDKKPKGEDKSEK
jgi:large subunit ribosomal protein L18